jgi:hypothetical protein
MIGRPRQTIFDSIWSLFEQVNECKGDVSPTINLASIPATAGPRRAELCCSIMTVVHKAKYELVGACRFDWAFVWFLFRLKHDPGASLGTWR